MPNRPQDCNPAWPLSTRISCHAKHEGRGTEHHNHVLMDQKLPTPACQPTTTAPPLLHPSEGHLATPQPGAGVLHPPLHCPKVPGGGFWWEPESWPCLVAVSIKQSQSASSRRLSNPPQLCKDQLCTSQTPQPVMRQERTARRGTSPAHAHKRRNQWRIAGQWAQSRNLPAALCCTSVQWAECSCTLQCSYTLNCSTTRHSQGSCTIQQTVHYNVAVHLSVSVHYSVVVHYSSTVHYSAAVHYSVAV